MVGHGPKPRSGLKEKDVMRDDKVKGTNMVHTERRHGKKSDIVKANRTVSKRAHNAARRPMLLGLWYHTGPPLLGQPDLHPASSAVQALRQQERADAHGVREARFAKKQRKSDHPYCMKCWVEIYGTENMTKSMPWMLEEDTDPVVDD
ncbi:hypothetical protein BC938DRAFT_472539 [Jimgerdemannia flammicorona]|uniref:Uncharacterized protein n=1 Tax=Jimgerdemannia flammicorona TaxID=994334 RepID=A0A433QTV3_9FUNG|nr:hypothetical protein BC938DRAFT_472539 [Jimgerdemannia flammicorona]